MTIRKLSARLLSGLCCAGLLLTGCGKPDTEEIRLSDLQTDVSFCMEGLTFGTDYETVLQKFYDEKLDPDSENFEDWRNSVLTQNGYRSLNPVETRTLCGQEWTMNFGFDDQDALYMAVYNCTTDAESFENVADELAKDCYKTFGEGSLPLDNVSALIADDENDRVGTYWTAEDGSYLQLLTMRTANGKCTVSICTGTPDSVTLLSGAAELAGNVKNPNG